MEPGPFSYETPLYSVESSVDQCRPVKLPTSTLIPPAQEASLILTVSVVGATADQQMPQVPLPAVSGSSHHGGGAERRGSSGTERQLPLLSRWLGAGTSLSGICCNSLISSLGARCVAAQENEMKVAVKSPKGSAFYSYSETQPSVLFVFFLFVKQPFSNLN